MIPSFLTPYLIWIKVALVVAVIGAAAGGGWKVRGWRCDAAHTSELAAQAHEAQEEIDGYKNALLAKDKVDAGQRMKFETQLGSLRKRNAELEEEIRNAPLNTITPTQDRPLVADEPFNLKFVRLWNAPIEDLYRALGVAADGPGLLGPDTAPAAVTREAVLQEHRHLVELFGDCKVKQNHAIEFDRRQGDRP